MKYAIRYLGLCLSLSAALVFLQPAYAATPSPELQRAVRASTFEVVLHKLPSDPLSYEKPLPLDLIPYVIRNDAYWSIGTAFAIGPNAYVSAGHVLLTAVGSQFGAPALRDGAGHVHPIDKVLKFSRHEDFIVFTVADASAAEPLPTSTERKIDDVVFAVGNALGEGVVIRDGLLTSETPEDQDGRWKWLRFSAAASPGNSGGPLLDAAGRVIGVVTAKSANENLNYALPISRVLDAGSQAATFDLRYTVKLPNGRDTQVATLKSEFALPKSFADFAHAYTQLQLQITQRDQLQLHTALADRLFPKGDSAKLLATVYDSPLLTFVQQDNTDAWDAVAPSEIVEQSLPDNGLVTTGSSLDTVVFRVRRPGAATDGKFYSDAAQFMEVLLKGLKLPRLVGDQAIRITSLGHPQQESVLEDQFGRRWQVAKWPLGYMDSYVLSYALPVPEGYAGMLRLCPSSQLNVTNEILKALADDAYVNYSGTLPQWQAFLSRRDLRPRIFDRIKIDARDGQEVGYQSARLTFHLTKDLIDASPDSELELHMSYALDAGKLAWDVGGIYWYQDKNRHRFVGVERHVKPNSESARNLLEVWERMSAHGPGFNRVAGHDNDFRNFWIHDAVSAPVAGSGAPDAAAPVLYDVFYGTDGNVYPRDLEDIERRLVLGTHVLER